MSKLKQAAIEALKQADANINKLTAKRENLLNKLSLTQQELVEAKAGFAELQREVENLDRKQTNSGIHSQCGPMHVGIASCFRH